MMMKKKLLAVVMVTVKNFVTSSIKNHLWVFINCLIVNPTFDSQTKENMTSQLKKFGSKCVSGLEIVGRNHYGVFPLRGKLLNVREATVKQFLENAEINNLI